MSTGSAASRASQHCGFFQMAIIKNKLLNSLQTASGLINRVSLSLTIGR